MNKVLILLTVILTTMSANKYLEEKDIEEELKIKALSTVKTEHIWKEREYTIGNRGRSCGKILEIEEFNNGIYFILKAKNGKNPLNLVVWEKEINVFKKNLGDLSNLKEKEVCARGSYYKHDNTYMLDLDSYYDLKIETP